jgi:hypothetical protein
MKGGRLIFTNSLTEYRFTTKNTGGVWLFPKKVVEEIPEEDTSIWSCSNDDCFGWMRDDFSFENVPTCPLCHSEMSQNIRLLPILVNNTKNAFQN